MHDYKDKSYFVALIIAPQLCALLYPSAGLLFSGCCCWFCFVHLKRFKCWAMPHFHSGRHTTPYNVMSHRATQIFSAYHNGTCSIRQSFYVILIHESNSIMILNWPVQRSLAATFLCIADVYFRYRNSYPSLRFVHTHAHTSIWILGKEWHKNCKSNVKV